MYIVKDNKKLFGEINLCGSKNAALPIIVAACLSEEKIILHNVPLQLVDVKILLDLLCNAGFNINKMNDDKLEFSDNHNRKINYEVSEEASKIRYSLLFL